MWNMIMERMPSTLGMFCTALAFLVPYVTYKINQKLHKDMDPPWKKEEKKQSSN
ncbi:hypothetical protein [Oceanobacillus senegalensis]|uniref:hypothetical protein n=1 Tax=Oceanobacillus senegalensis TaxID=1936063 RepID=UPI0015C43A36|nr:hypothetical protein [Oceanobacillus senegalensis]